MCRQVWDGDFQDSNWRPPKGYDGTPPESAADVLTRMRQLLSVTETQYTGEDVVIIAPDSDTLSILQVGWAGLIHQGTLLNRSCHVRVGLLDQGSAVQGICML